MAISCLNTSATEKYISQKDSARNADGTIGAGATVWHLGALDSYVEAQIATMGTSYDYSGLEGMDTSKMTNEERGSRIKVNVDVYAMSIEAVRLCLKGWTNLKDGKGNDIEFKTVRSNIKGRFYEAVAPELMAMIPKDILIELYAEIQRISSLTETERKNSVAG